MSEAPVVIIGAGQAGGRAAEALRQSGYSGQITIVGDEVHLPYERPALSKEFLGDGSLKRIAWVRQAAWYEENGITLLLGRKALKINRDQHAVALDDGTAVSYRVLLIATGSRPRTLAIPGSDHPRITYLRTIDDSQKLYGWLGPASHVVVIGAGLIGLEVSAAAVALGSRVTVLEATDRAMARCVPAAIGTFYADLHRKRGVNLRTGVNVSRIEDLDGRVALVLSSEEKISADAVVVGIGVVPNVELAQDVGLAVDDGIVVDAYGRTSDPAIYAAGDVTRHLNPLLGRHVRLESWQNAQNQAIAVARIIAGGETPYAEVPWCWSDQFGVNLQIAGLPAPGDDVIQRGDLGAGPAIFFHLRNERLVAAVGINSGRDIRFAKEIMALGGHAGAGLLADPSIGLAAIHRDLKLAAKAA